MSHRTFIKVLDDGLHGTFTVSMWRSLGEDTIHLQRINSFGEVETILLDEREVDTLFETIKEACKSVRSV